MLPQSGKGLPASTSSQEANHLAGQGARLSPSKVTLESTGLPNRKMNKLQSQFRRNLIGILKAFFEERAAALDIDMAFLYGSWAGGYPRKDSDVDVALCFLPAPSSEEALFDRLTDISLELSLRTKREVNVIPIYDDFRKPMLYYNAVVLGLPLYIKDFSRYADLKNQSVFQMEDFGLFGIPWQIEVARKHLKELQDA